MFARARRACVVATFSAGAMLACPAAHAEVVERIVAVVAHRPILLSEVDRRARASSHGQSPTPKELHAALDATIDARALDWAAAIEHVSISPSEIDRGIANSMTQLGVTPAEFWARVHKNGYSDPDYREEVRMQLLEAQLFDRRFRGRIAATDADRRAAYERLLHDRTHQAVEIECLSLPIASSTPVAAQERLALRVVRLARAGASFCGLVHRSTGMPCGPEQVFPDMIVPVAHAALDRMRPGDVSDPIPIGDRSVLAIRLVGRRPRTPGARAVDDEANAGALLRVRRAWLDELRVAAGADVRL